MTKIRGSILECIGHTPILRLNRLSRALGVELLGKAEFLNPAGSLKDRVAQGLVEEAESSGRLKPGDTITEATAGNTGIGLALVAAARGYRFVAVMTEADRGVKSEAMEAFGAEVVFTPYGVRWDTAEGPCGVAERLAAERGGVYLNQFGNPENPRVHERTTGIEILEQLGDGLDAVILGVGTGGTATGVARALRPRVPGLRLIGVSAEGSYLGSGLPGDRIAGITPDFAPTIFERGLLDAVETVTAPEAARAARRIAEEEGIPAGHSSGAALVVAGRLASQQPGMTILFLLADVVRNYRRLGRD